MPPANNLPLALLQTDDAVLKAIEGKISAALNPDEAAAYSKLYLTLKKDLEVIHLEKRKSDLKIRKERDQLNINRFNSIVKFALGVGLCIGSYFVIPFSPYLGATMLGSGLGALGIHVNNLRLKKD
jgi:hypothetical protein